MRDKEKKKTVAPYGTGLHENNLLLQTIAEIKQEAEASIGADEVGVWYSDELVITKKKNEHAVAMGRIGGLSRSEAKRAAGRINCKKATEASIAAAAARREGKNNVTSK